MPRKYIPKVTYLETVREALERTKLPEWPETVDVKKRLVTALNALGIDHEKVTARTVQRDFQGTPRGELVIYNPRMTQKADWALEEMALDVANTKGGWFRMRLFDTNRHHDQE